MKTFKIKKKPSRLWVAGEKRISAPWWVKLLKIALLSVLITSCEAEEIAIEKEVIVTITDTVYLPEPLVFDTVVANPEKVFPTWIVGEFDPYQLPEASNMICSESQLNIDFTGWESLQYEFDLTNASVQVEEERVWIGFEDLVLEFQKTTTPDIKLTVYKAEEVIELGYFIKQ